MPQLGDLLARVALGETLGGGEAETLRLEFNNLQSIGAIAKKWAAPNGELDLSFLPIQVLYSKRLPEDIAGIDIQVPSVINNLLILGNGRSTSDHVQQYASVLARFNDDTGANYDWQYLYAFLDSHSAHAVVADSTMLLGLVANAESPAASSGMWFSAVSNCQSAFHKTISTSSGHRPSTTGIGAYYTYGNWRSTERVNKLTLYLSMGNWVASSMITVLGIV